MSEQAAPLPKSSHQGLWGFLLLLDALFVVLFGGTLAMKAYQHWQEPAAPVIQPHHKPPRNGQPAAKPAAPAAAAPAPAPAPAAPKPAKAEAASESSPRPPKPSLLHEAPVHQKAAPQTASKSAAPAAPAAAAPAAAGGKSKAVPTDFTIKAPGARSVELVGAFIVRGGRKPMVSHPDGTWTLTLYLTPNTYRYWFAVNGKKTLDPQNSAVDRGASVVTVNQ